IRCRALPVRGARVVHVPYRCSVRCSGPPGPVPFPSSEIEPAFARRIRQGLDAAVVEVAAAVEDHVLDALGRCPLRDQLTDRLRRRDIGAGLEAAAHVLLQRGRGRNRLALHVVDHLRVDVLRRAEDRKPRAACGGAADIPPYFRRAPCGPISDCRHDALPSLLLAVPALRDQVAQQLAGGERLAPPCIEATKELGTLENACRAIAGADHDRVFRRLRPEKLLDRHFFLPSLRKMYSFAYLTPLPL